MPSRRHAALTRGASITLGLLVAAGAAGAAGAQTPTHAYTLNGTFADALGGPSLTPLGGTLGPTGYTFPANQGLALASAIDPTNYSIELTFNFAAGTDLNSWRKVLDFENRNSDFGVYAFNQQLQFYNEVTAPVPAVQAGVPLHLIVTRNAADDMFSAFINGQLQFSFDDVDGLATFTGPNNVVHFLTDDFIVTGESAPGFIDWIRIYDRPLTVAQAADRYERGDDPLTHSTVPEPGTVLLTATGLAGLALAARRRRAPSPA